jgi:CelD/BcsL family acetyltransferase involved in cellulose biosynthesis
MTLRGIRTGTPPYDALLEAARQRGCPAVTCVERQSSVLAIDGGFDDFFGALSSTFRESMRRKLRKAEKGGAKVELYDASADPDRITDRAFSVALRSWKHREGTSIASTPQLQRFYRDLIHRAAAAGWLRVAFLRVGDRDLAFELNADYVGARYNFKMYVDEDNGALSPGLVLRYHVLRDTFASGLSAFHFLGLREPHKDHWANHWHDYARVTIFNRRVLPLGRYFLSGPVKRAVKRIVPARLVGRSHWGVEVS